MQQGRPECRPCPEKDARRAQSEDQTDAADDREAFRHIGAGAFGFAKEQRAPGLDAWPEDAFPAKLEGVLLGVDAGPVALGADPVQRDAVGAGRVGLADAVGLLLVAERLRPDERPVLFAIGFGDGESGMAELETELLGF